MCLRGLVVDSMRKHLGEKQSFYKIIIKKQNKNILTNNTITYH